MGSWHPEADVGSQDRSRDCRKPARHHRVDLREGEVAQVRLNEEGGRGLAHEYVGGGVEGLAGRGANGGLEQPAQLDDQPLEGAPVVQHRHKETTGKLQLLIEKWNTGWI